MGAAGDEGSPMSTVSNSTLPDDVPILTSSRDLDDYPSLAKNYLDFHSAGIDVVRRSEFNSRESARNIVRLASEYLHMAQNLFSPLQSTEYDACRTRIESAEQKYVSAAVT
jgi:hypothetical protein